MINSLAVFNKEMRTTSSMINRGCYGTNLSETLSIFNWEPIPIEKTLKDMTFTMNKLSK